MGKKKHSRRPRLSRQAQREKKRFEKAFRQFIAQQQKISLTILVWGQNPDADTPIANKRREIRDELIRLGHHAAFSEDLPTADANLSTKSAEFAQARAAHVVLILPEDSPGATAEAHDFCGHPDLSHKIFVLLPESYRDGYSGKGVIADLDAAYGGVRWYSEHALVACDVLSEAVRRVEALRQMRYIQGRS